MLASPPPISSIPSFSLLSDLFSARHSSASSPSLPRSYIHPHSSSLAPQTLLSIGYLSLMLSIRHHSSIYMFQSRSMAKRAQAITLRYADNALLPLLLLSRIKYLMKSGVIQDQCNLDWTYRVIYKSKTVCYWCMVKVGVFVSQYPVNLMALGNHCLASCYSRSRSL